MSVGTSPLPEPFPNLACAKEGEPMSEMIRSVGRAIQENPSIAAGTCAFAVAFFMVSGNALYGQVGKHPGPLWATRDPVVTRAIAGKDEARKPPERAAALGAGILNVPVPLSRPDPRAAAALTDDLLRDAQRALAALGMYGGEIDGRMGPRTRDAIIRFQKSAGAAVTGEPDAALIQAMRRTVGARKPDERNAADPAIVNSVRDMLAAAGDAAPPAAEVESLTDATRTATIARIQIGLWKFGEAGVSVDGRMNGATAAAIRAFQARYGLKVDGEPGPEVIQKLEALGVLQKI